MKKYFFLLVVMLLGLPAVAQSHLEFSGIPITGNVNNFVAKLNSKGYTKIDEYPGLVYMEGTFTNQDVQLSIVYTPVTKTVWKVVVMFEKQYSWSLLRDSYYTYKDMYIRKYGEPTDCYESFSGGHYDGDGYELDALSEEKISFISFFDPPYGSIRLEITSYGCVWIHYEDEVGTELLDQEELDEI